jgi:hypothetical protein
MCLKTKFSGQRHGTLLAWTKRAQITGPAKFMAPFTGKPFEKLKKIDN